MTQLVTVEGNNLIDGMLGTAAFTATTGPLKVRLMTANGTATTAGTQLTGGSYPAGGVAVTFSAAASQSATNSADVVFSGNPAATVVGIELWDATPTRKAFGPLTASKTLLGGDTLTFSAGTLIVSWA